jgi:uncharacterized protein (UPF0297 family)
MPIDLSCMDQLVGIGAYTGNPEFIDKMNGARAIVRNL